LSVIGYALLFFVIFAVIYYVPGRLAYALLADPREPEESLPLSLGLGLVLVNVTAVTDGRARCFGFDQA